MIGIPRNDVKYILNLTDEMFMSKSTDGRKAGITDVPKNL